MTPAQFRRLALALPDVVEGAHQGHPDFRAHGRVFATLHPDGVRAMVKVAPDVQERLCAQGGEPAAGAWGRAGCTLFVLADADAQRMGRALADAWQFAFTATAAKGGKSAQPATKTARERTPPQKTPRKRAR